MYQHVQYKFYLAFFSDNSIVNLNFLFESRLKTESIFFFILALTHVDLFTFLAD